MTIHTVLVLLAGVVILALLAYLLYLLNELRLQRRSEAELRQRFEEENQKMHEDRIMSIELLCIAALDGDCDLSEACIRIHKLLEYYPGLRKEAPARVVAAMYEEVQEFATHDARRALSVSERHDQDDRRAAIEARYHDALMESFRALKERMQELKATRFDLDLAG